jgi:DNA-directed RNA polymerase subunit RPC12/RpoP
VPPHPLLSGSRKSVNEWPDWALECQNGRRPCFNTPMAGPRREVKLPYRELNIACPHCRAPLTIGTVMDRILLSRRTCSKCGKEFLIENDVPKKPDGGLKKPSESVKPVRAVKGSKSR